MPFLGRGVFMKHIDNQTKPPVALHIVLCQADDYGLDGLRSANGFTANRHDTLINAQQMALMRDGEWPRDVNVTTLVGMDVVNMNGAIQPVMAPIRQTRDDGSVQRFAVTTDAFENTYFRKKGLDHDGLTWVCGRKPVVGKETAKDVLVENLQKFLDDQLKQTPQCVAMCMDYREAVPYERLKQLGAGKLPRAEKVFILMGGAHGFDNKGDKDGVFLQRLINTCREKLGATKVARVTLNSDQYGGCVHTSGKVAGYMSMEHSCGNLVACTAGLEEYMKKGHNGLLRASAAQPVLVKPSQPPTRSVASREKTAAVQAPWAAISDAGASSTTVRMSEAKTTAATQTECRDVIIPSSLPSEEIDHDPVVFKRLRARFGLGKIALQRELDAFEDFLMRVYSRYEQPGSECSTASDFSGMPSTPVSLAMSQDDAADEVRSVAETQEMLPALDEALASAIQAQVSAETSEGALPAPGVPADSNEKAAAERSHAACNTPEKEDMTAVVVTSSGASAEFDATAWPKLGEKIGAKSAGAAHRTAAKDVRWSALAPKSQTKPNAGGKNAGGKNS
eukprot:TRINITY_DN112441_c0_g1_i1.p1 TRINITY_DN112441_c0_g1~~TRINITY_DN112441_c0_g1_i1.p1  ORF type:complete len:564 (+),score=131.60 TRINITY_DN112441_c0_g1_i1:88-1779(+)